MRPFEFVKTQLPEPNPDDALGASIRKWLRHNYSQYLSTNPQLVLLTLAVVIVVVPLSAKAGFLSVVSDFLSGEELVYERPLAKQTAGDVKLLSAGISPDPTANQGGGDIIVEEGALLSSGPFAADDYSTTNNGQISIHTIRPCTEEQCETLSHIADMYGVSVNTILWANDIDDPNLIKPGDDLVILPITGVRHLVKDGDTLNKIAKKYGAETDEQVESMVADILNYNRLASAADVHVGDIVVVPGGTMHTAAPKTSPTKSSSPTRVAQSSGASGLVNPVPGAIKTQGIHGYNAVDLAASIGTAVRAAADGEVILSKSGGWNGGYGTYIVIRHANGVQTLYSHMSQNYVGVGASVSAGETIGAVGNTGKSTGPHLHFEVRGATNPF